MLKRFLLCLGLLCTPLLAAENPATPAPTPVPLAEVAPQLEQAQEALRRLEATLQAPASEATPEAEAPARLAAADKLALEGPISLEELSALEATWEKRARQAAANRAALDQRLDALEAALLSDRWKQTLQAGAELPPEVRKAVEALLAELGKRREVLQLERRRTLSLQNRATKEATPVQEMVAALKASRDQAVGRLLVKDRPALWSPAAWSPQPEAGTVVADQWAALRAYLAQHPGRAALQAALFLSLVLALRWLRPWLARVSDQRALEGTEPLVEMPASTALLIALAASHWFYPDPPRLFWVGWSVLLLIPAVLLLRRLVPPQIAPWLQALVVFQLLDQVRRFLPAGTLAGRLFFLGELLLAAGCIAGLLRSGGLREVLDPARPLGRVVRAFFLAALGGLLVAAGAYAGGYIGLGTLLGEGVLASAYLGAICYALLAVAEGAVMIALQVPPLGRLAMVRHHRTLLWQRVRRGLRWVALFLWASATVSFLSLHGFVAEKGAALLATRLSLGSLSLSVGNLLACGLTIWATFLLSRFVRFVLEEEVYGRLRLPRGIPFAISRVVHYLLLVAGFTLALGALGVDATKFTILAGAVGVGIGFGLQNIVNNFVSGLILLFERPLKVGDVLQVDNLEGTVTHIGIRASILRMESGSEVILPNGKLISDKVTNWTLSNSLRGVEIPVSVPRAADARVVIPLLLAAAEGHPKALKNPKPEALLLTIGPANCDYQLRLWTLHQNEWHQIRSEVTLALHAALREAGVL